MDNEEPKKIINGITKESLSALQKDFVVIGKTRVKSWTAWLAIGLMAGIVAGVILVAEQNAFPKSKAKKAPKAEVERIKIPPSLVFHIQGEPSELFGFNHGAVVTPALGPKGTLVKKGTGLVNFVPAKIGNGVFFGPERGNLNNNAHYRFTGLSLKDVFNLEGGEITFYLKSRYSWAERDKVYGFRHLFHMSDGQEQPFRFAIHSHSQPAGMSFMYNTSGTDWSYVIPKGQEDALFGKDKILKVRLAWDGKVNNLYLNDKLVKTQAYPPPKPFQWDNAVFTLASHVNGVEVFNDIIDEFKVLSLKPPFQPTFVIAPPTIEVEVGKTAQLKALYDPDGPSGPKGEEDVTLKASWSSGKPEIATIDKGTVTGVKEGATSVGAKFQNLIAIAQVTVKEPPPPVGVQIKPLTSQIAAISWKTDQPTFASVEYKTSPFAGNKKEGTLFPLKTMSASQYTKVLSTRHDLCPTGLIPNTRYYARVWDKDAPGKETVSQQFTFKTPSAPVPVYTFSKNWYGLQLAEEWRSLDEPRKKGAIDQPYIRTVEALQQWDEIQPTPDQFRWRLVDDKGNAIGIDNQLDEIKARAGAELGKSKFINLLVRAGGGLGGKRMPDWAGEGVESAIVDGEDDLVVRWDPQYACRYWQLAKAAGERYDNDTAITIVPIQAVSKTGEMTMSDNLVTGLRALGYQDADIASNMKWLYRNSLNVYAESFPHKRFKMNMGRIKVMDGSQEVSYSILDELGASYGKRIGFGTTGFGGFRADLQNRYKNKVVVGGFSEEPKKDSPDPVKELQDIFTQKIWPIADTGGNLGWVSLHDDALGILSKRWGDLPELKILLQDVEKRFADLRK